MTGRWLVADYTVDGRRLSDSLFGAAEGIEQTGVFVRVAGATIGSSSVGIHLELENRRDEPILLTRGWRGSRIGGLFWQYVPIPLGPKRALPPHESAIVFLGWRERHRGVLRLVLRGGHRGASSTVTLRLQIPEPPSAVVTPFAAIPWQVRFESWRWISLPVPLLAAGALLLFHRFTAGAAVVAAYAMVVAVEEAWAWRRELSTARQLLGFVSYPLALLALATLLLAIGR